MADVSEFATDNTTRPSGEVRNTVSEADVIQDVEKDNSRSGVDRGNNQTSADVRSSDLDCCNVPLPGKGQNEDELYQEQNSFQLFQAPFKESSDHDSRGSQLSPASGQSVIIPCRKTENQASVISREVQSDRKSSKCIKIPKISQNFLTNEIWSISKERQSVGKKYNTVKRPSDTSRCLADTANHPTSLLGNVLSKLNSLVATVGEASEVSKRSKCFKTRESPSKICNSSSARRIYNSSSPSRIYNSSSSKIYNSSSPSKIYNSSLQTFTVGDIMAGDDVDSYRQCTTNILPSSKEKAEDKKPSSKRLAVGLRDFYPISDNERHNKASALPKHSVNMFSTHGRRDLIVCTQDIAENIEKNQSLIQEQPLDLSMPRDATLGAAEIDKNVCSINEKILMKNVPSRSHLKKVHRSLKLPGDNYLGLSSARLVSESIRDMNSRNSFSAKFREIDEPDAVRFVSGSKRYQRSFKFSSSTNGASSRKEVGIGVQFPTERRQFRKQWSSRKPWISHDRPNAVSSTQYQCSCGTVFETLYHQAVHMEATGHCPSRKDQYEYAAFEYQKLVRGQDMWLNYGSEQAREILRCMRCSRSFESLSELTLHMIRTKHYEEIVGSTNGKHSQSLVDSYGSAYLKDRTSSARITTRSSTTEEAGSCVVVGGDELNGKAADSAEQRKRGQAGTCSKVNDDDEAIGMSRCEVSHRQCEPVTSNSVASIFPKGKYLDSSGRNRVKEEHQNSGRQKGIPVEAQVEEDLLHFGSISAANRKLITSETKLQTEKHSPFSTEGITELNVNKSAEDTYSFSEKPSTSFERDLEKVTVEKRRIKREEHGTTMCGVEGSTAEDELEATAAAAAAAKTRKRATACDLHNASKHSKKFIRHSPKWNDRSIYKLNQCLASSESPGTPSWPSPRPVEDHQRQKLSSGKTFSHQKQTNGNCDDGEEASISALVAMQDFIKKSFPSRKYAEPADLNKPDKAAQETDEIRTASSKRQHDGMHMANNGCDNSAKPETKPGRFSLLKVHDERQLHSKLNSKLSFAALFQRSLKSAKTATAGKEKQNSVMTTRDRSEDSVKLNSRRSSSATSHINSKDRSATPSTTEFSNQSVPDAKSCTGKRPDGPEPSGVNGKQTDDINPTNKWQTSSAPPSVTFCCESTSDSTTMESHARNREESGIDESCTFETDDSDDDDASFESISDNMFENDARNESINAPRCANPPSKRIQKTELQQPFNGQPETLQPSEDEFPKLSLSTVRSTEIKDLIKTSPYVYLPLEHSAMLSKYSSPWVAARPWSLVHTRFSCDDTESPRVSPGARD